MIEIRTERLRGLTFLIADIDECGDGETQFESVSIGARTSKGDLPINILEFSPNCYPDRKVTSFVAKDNLIAALGDRVRSGVIINAAAHDVKEESGPKRPLLRPRHVVVDEGGRDRCHRTRSRC